MEERKTIPRDTPAEERDALTALIRDGAREMGQSTWGSQQRSRNTATAIFED